jgi:SAM-dependent methyltransferase/uncharacterized protein YbaR (Trm112 family)
MKCNYAMRLDRELLELLADPVDGSLLGADAEGLLSYTGHRYPVINGIPVLLRDDVQQTMGIAERSITLSKQDSADSYFVETLGLSDDEKRAIREELSRGTTGMDPVIKYVLNATNGLAYVRASNASAPPIPILPISGKGRLLDVGCNWGRWSIAATRVGFRPVGIDPSLGALLAGKRLAEQMGLKIHFVCGDARYLPFRSDIFDAAFSYSVLQHFSKSDVSNALSELRRTLRPGGESMIQMANAFGFRSFLVCARRRFREPTGFEVRYWTPRELAKTFTQKIGETRLSPDCFFGLGLQASDMSHMTICGAAVTSVSETVKALEIFNWFADSVYCKSRKPIRHQTGGD